jgi:hypothetical protein
MGEMTVLNQSGDITIQCDPDDAESVEDRLKADGYEFFEPVESKGKRLTKFDKKKAKVIAAPGVQTKQDKAAGTRGKAMAGGPVAQHVGPAR